MSTPRRIRVRVSSLRVVGGSTIDARRVADALPAALERALAGEPSRPATGPRPPRHRALTDAELVATSVATRVLSEAAAAGAAVTP